MILNKSCKEPDNNLKIGKIIEVDGTHIIIELDKNIDELTRVYNTEIYSIGQFGSIVKSYYGNTLLFMFITRLRLKSEIELEKGISPLPNEDSRVLEAELFGEGHWYNYKDNETEKCLLKFERGISIYPLPQQFIYLTTSQELKLIYEANPQGTIPIGHYVGSGSTPCYLNINELVNKHAAIIGSTGSGKSGTVAAMLHAISSYKPTESENWHPYIIILDPHNEYSSAFPDAKRLVSDEGTLKLPYWLLNLQELIELIIGRSESQASSQANILKKAILSSRIEGANTINNKAKTIKIKSEDITVDSPVPFSLEVLEKYINEEKQAGKSAQQEKCQNLLNRIAVLKDDKRLKFLMEDWVSEEDEIQEVICQFISAEKPLKIIDLSGIPSDVAGIVTSIISRLLFMYKLWELPEERKQDPILLVCEEAHRYVPNRGEAIYSSAQDAIKRIAKEGRKYGLCLLLVSQRPSELEQTVLAQCNTWIVLRLTNQEDQTYVTKYLPDSLRGLVKMLPALRQREAIIIGQAVPIPSRVVISKLSDDKLPNSQDISFIDGWSALPIEKVHIERVADNWRRQNRSFSESNSN